MKHSEGPWEADEYTVRSKNNEHVAVVSTLDDFACVDQDELHPETLEEMQDVIEGNLRLVVEAPEMYRVLSLALAESGCRDGCAHTWHEEARRILGRLEEPIRRK